MQSRICLCCAGAINPASPSLNPNVCRSCDSLIDVDEVMLSPEIPDMPALDSRPNPELSQEANEKELAQDHALLSAPKTEPPQEEEGPRIAA